MAVTAGASFKGSARSRMKRGVGSQERPVYGWTRHIRPKKRCWARVRSAQDRRRATR